MPNTTVPIIAPITIEDLTTKDVSGTGVFDCIMQANKAHLDEQFKLGRIKGPEYSTVYLGSLEAVLNSSVTFLLSKDKAALEAQLIAQQVLLTQAEIAKAEVQVRLAEQQLLNSQAELEILLANKSKVAAEILMIEAQTRNTNLEANNIPKQGIILDKQALDITQKTANAVIEGTVLRAQECKLKAEFDYTVINTTKGGTENNLLLQKVITEKAQTSSVGISEDSVIGKQKLLYTAQTNGFARDAEQKAAKLMADTWNARRMTDEATSANTTNKLDDASVGAAITKMLSGINSN